MHARVATWEGGSAEAIRAGAEEIRSRAEQGPPEGVRSTGFTMLVDPDGGRVVMIGMFASEEDLRASEAALEAMTPPEGIGTRTGVEILEVGFEVRM